MSPLASGGLARLALRRTASAGTMLWSALVALALALASSAPPAAWLEAGASDPLVAAGLARQNVWSGFLVAIVPLIVFRAARDAAFWRRRDSAWLACRAASNAHILVSAWLGVALACVAFASATFVLAEISAGDAGDALRLAGSIAGPGVEWVDGRKPLDWRAEENAASRSQDATVRIELGLGGGAGAACGVVLRVRRATDPATAWARETHTHIGNRGAVEVALPGGSGALEFQLALGEPDARLLVLSERLTVYARGSGAHAASLAVLERMLLALSAWTALAIGFSTWVSAPTSALGVLALLAPAWWSEGAGAPGLAWLPGADLVDALGIVGAGRVPAELAAIHVAGAILFAGIGLAVGLAGLARWRRAR